MRFLVSCAVFMAVLVVAGLLGVHASFWEVVAVVLACHLSDLAEEALS